MKKRYLAMLLALVFLLCSCDVGGLLPVSTTGGASQATTVVSPEQTTASQTEQTTGNSTEQTTDGSTEQTTAPSGGETTAPTVEQIKPDPNCTHTDADENGICDGCLCSVIINLDFYAVNDLHGKVCDSDSQPGIEELTTYFRNAYENDENAILLSSGDTWQGSSESNLTKGLLLTDWMNEMDFVSMTLGNHEFDWGEAYIEQNAEVAEFPFLAINIFDRETDTRVPYCTPSVMIERSGVQIGIIGAIGDCYSSISAEHVQDIYFKVGKDLTALVKEESDALRGAGADLIVYVLHDGYGSSKSGTTTVSSSQIASYYDLSLSNGYVDLVFEGHTHQRYVLRDTYGVYHLQGGGENRGISHVDLNVNIATDDAFVLKAEYLANSTYSSLDEDALIGELLLKYDELIAPSREILGDNDRYRSSTYLRELVAELYYRKGVELWGEEYDIVLGGGFLSVRNPYELEAGKVTYAMLQSIFPFDNQLHLCSVKGSDLKSKFFETSNSNYFIYYEEYGAAVYAELDPDATYYIIVDSYTSVYKWNNLTVVEEYDAECYARDLLADYIRQGGLSQS